MYIVEKKINGFFLYIINLKSKLLKQIILNKKNLFYKGKLKNWENLEEGKKIKMHQLFRWRQTKRKLKWKKMNPRDISNEIVTVR